MRIILVAVVVGLFVGCGHGNPTAPTSGATPTPPLPPVPTAARSYEVMFVADAACTDLPPVARRRTYVGSGGPLLHLSGAEFGTTVGYSSWDIIYLELSRDSAEAYLSDPPIWEHLTAQSDLVVDGNAKTTLSGEASRLSFNFRRLHILPCGGPSGERVSKCQVPEIRCRSTNHQLTLSRQ